MKKIFIFILLTLSSNVFSQHKLLYSFKGEKRVETIELNEKSALSLEEFQTEMLESELYDFVEIDSIQYEAYQNEENLNLEAGWHHEAIHTQKAWESIKNPSQIIVAVCDSGLDSEHQDLKNVSVPGFSFVDDENDTSANTHHGTMVSGLIAGQLSEEFSTSGIAPFVKIMPIRITNKKGSTSLSTIVNCIQYAADNGAKVINVSFTGVENMAIEKAGEYAAERGALLVYSAGNQGKHRAYPNHKNVVIVGGVEKDLSRWDCSTWIKKCGSNYGDFIDLVAPAKAVFTTTAYMGMNDGSSPYKAVNGTSFSAPIVSAVAALIYSVNPYFTTKEVETILKTTSRELGAHYIFGTGIVDAEKAIKRALAYAL